MSEITGVIKCSSIQKIGRCVPVCAKCLGGQTGSLDQAEGCFRVRASSYDALLSLPQMALVLDVLSCPFPVWASTVGLRPESPQPSDILEGP